jgi:hypothetical protein
MASSPHTKVVLIQTVLLGSNMSSLLQEVATVHANDREFRVYAPPTAKGEALEWVPHFTIRRQGGYFSEEKEQDRHKELTLRAVKEALENQERDTSMADGTHPDGIHCSAQICRNGDIQRCNGMPFDSREHCTKCGASCIHECPGCREPIRGSLIYRDTRNYSVPQFCHGCGRPYPWMAESLDTARDSLWHDDQLTLEDREKLWNDLKYVMSNQKADLVPAKRKLIEIKLAKAGEVVRVAFSVHSGGACIPCSWGRVSLARIKSQLAEK